MMNSCSSTGSSYSMGFRFHPVDEELLRYLLKFVSGNPIECDHIRMLDVYGNKKPCDIFNDLSSDGESTDVNYFFTQLKKKSTGGKNFKRTVLGGGTWKGLDSGKEVVSKKGPVIGLKKSYRFIDDGNNNDQKIVWNMKEYCLSDSLLKSLRGRNLIRYEDYVLCRIKRKLAVRGDHHTLRLNYCHDQELGERNSNMVSSDHVQTMAMLGSVRADDQKHDIHYTCSAVPMSNSEEATINVVSDHHDQTMVGLGYVGADGRTKDTDYTCSTVPISCSEEGFCDRMNVHGDQIMNGFCATTYYDKEEDIGLVSRYQEQVSLYSSDKYYSDQGIATNISGENFNVVSGEQPMPMPMAGYCLQDDQHHHHIDSSCALTSSCLEEGYYICDDIEFALLEVDEQEFKRAKASGPSLEETFTELSNLLQGNDADQYYNVLRGLLPTTDDQSSQQMPDLISPTADKVQFYCHGAPMSGQVGIRST